MAWSVNKQQVEQNSFQLGQFIVSQWFYEVHMVLFLFPSKYTNNKYKI